MTTLEDQTRDLESTLLGDSRERVLDIVKRYVDWKTVPEVKQRALVSAVEQVCRENIRHIALITAGREHATYEVRVSGLVQKTKSDGESFIEAKITADDTNENALGLLRAGSCLLVKADLQAFMGERAASEILKDQPDLMETAEEVALSEADAEAAHIAENTARLEEGIGQLEAEGEADLPPHDPETGEVVVDVDKGPFEPAPDRLEPAAAEGGPGGSAFEWSEADQQQRPKQSRRKKAATETAPA